MAFSAPMLGVEPGHLGDDVRHVVRPTDVGRILVRVVGRDQVAAVVARAHAGVVTGGGLADAAAGEIRVEVEIEPTTAPRTYRSACA